MNALHAIRVHVVPRKSHNLRMQTYFNEFNIFTSSGLQRNDAIQFNGFGLQDIYVPSNGIMLASRSHLCWLASQCYFMNIIPELQLPKRALCTT